MKLLLLILLSISLYSFALSQELKKEIEIPLNVSKKMIKVPILNYPILSDTIPVLVDISKNSIDTKIIKVPFGKVIFFFSQKDYLKKEIKQDTLLILPENLNMDNLNQILKEGKAKVYRISNASFIKRYTHRLKQYASMADREFYFENEDENVFFMLPEIYGLIPTLSYSLKDSLEQATDKINSKLKPTEKEYAYIEEFPNFNDTTRIKIKEYFPLNQKNLIIYKEYGNSNEYKDTLKTEFTILQDIKAYYFNEYEYPYSSVNMISNNMVGWPGLYYYQNDSLYGIEIDYDSEIKNIKSPKSKSEVFLPKYIQVGDSIVKDSKSNKKVTTYLGLTDITIDKLTYKDCAKFKLITHWKTTSYLSYFWLHKGSGLIRRDFDSGLIYEYKLLKTTKPNTIYRK